MSQKELIKNLDEIKNQKDTYLLPENIKEDVIVLGITGTYKGLDTSDGTATPEDIIEGKTAYVNKEKITGTLKGLTELTPVNAHTVITQNNMLQLEGNVVDKGIISSELSHKVRASNEQVSTAIGLAPDIIRKGANILGIEGTYDSNPEEYNAKFATPEGVTSNLTPLKMLVSIESIDTSHLTSAANIFSQCVSLKSLPDMNLESATTTCKMCSNCINLTYVPNLSIPKVSDISYMFENCSNLSKVNLTNNSAVANVTGAFSGCASLQNAPDFNWSRCANSGGLTAVFNGCTNITYVDLRRT